MPDTASHPSSVSDGELVARAAQGEERAIGLLYDRYGGVLYAVAYRIVGQRADAEEVVVEAFAQAWREAPRFESGRGSVAGWLTTIGRSRALDLVRARSRRDRITASAAAFLSIRRDEAARSEILCRAPRAVVLLLRVVG